MLIPLVRPACQAAFLLVLIGGCLLCPLAQAQNNNNNNNGNNGGFVFQGAVGGVAIDANGSLQNAEVDAQGRLLALREMRLDPVPQDLAAKTQLRRVSLRRLEDQIQTLVAQKQELPESILFLAGLQQIEYVLFYPEENDIVLVGPAEGWKLNPRGAVVGQTTGRPVLLLDDLLVALRSVEGSNPSVLTCSIDPSPEGLQRLAQAVKSQRGGDPQQAALEIEKLLGPQKITVTGVPASSHFARVMVAADYRMKRISLNLDPSPLKQLPSFVEMARTGGSGLKGNLPRWWLAPDYQPLLRDADGLAWQLRGAAVKTMCESDYLDAAGVRHQGSGKADAVSQRWADLMTQHYEALALADPVFGQLRNCMDLAIVAALIAQQTANNKITCDLPTLSGKGTLAAAELDAPKQVDTKASLVHKSRSWLVAAGGVAINPWAILDKAEQGPKLAEVRTPSANAANVWWWD